MHAVSFRVYRLPGWSLSRQRQTTWTGFLSAVDRAVDSSVFQALREAAATDRTIGAAIAGANLHWAQCRAKMVQECAEICSRSCACTLSSRLDEGLWACWLSPSQDPVGVCSIGPPLGALKPCTWTLVEQPTPQADSTTLYNNRDAGKGPSSRSILCHVTGQCRCRVILGDFTQ